VAVKVPASELSSIAAVVSRLAVLLAAGVPPAAAWGYLASSRLSATVVADVRAGLSIPDAIGSAASAEPSTTRSAWTGLAAAWDVATEAGAALAPTLREFAGSLRDLAQAQREIGVALAAPTATARLVLALPLVGILFGMLLGFDTLGVLVTTPPGWICLAVGAGLLLGASRWNRRLVRRARPRELTPGLGFDLMAIAVSGGASLDRAVRSVTKTVERFGLRTAVEDAEIADVLELSRRAGVPAADLLKSEANECRRNALATAQSSAQALGVRLMIPLGVCVLPAFMVLSVAPLLIAVLRQTSILG
jgi:tight adherence protein B